MRNAINTIIAVKTIKGTSFVGLRGYENKFNEVTNQTFLVGINYANLLKKDLEKLTSIAIMRNVVKMYQDNEKVIVKKGYNELVSSLEKRTSSEQEKAKLLAQGDKTIKASQAQQDAYITIAKGLRLNKETRDLYLFGLCVKKTVLEQGTYPTKKSQKKTIIKNQIKKFAELRDTKIKNFKLGKADELKLQGITL